MKMNDIDIKKDLEKPSLLDFFLIANLIPVLLSIATIVFATLVFLFFIFVDFNQGLQFFGGYFEKDEIIELIGPVVLTALMAYILVLFNRRPDNGWKKLIRFYAVYIILNFIYFIIVLSFIEMTNPGVWILFLIWHIFWFVYFYKSSQIKAYFKK